ncbi:MAG: inositol monophosphatase [Chloroflexi bacterium]|nr:MAG: inositol monophosphatase [Chloroflexota bacterium]
MTVERVDPVALGLLASAIAREAGALLLDGFEGTRTVEAKTTPTDAVTEMDRASEALIVRRILEVRPDDGILAEEGAARDGRTGVRWVIDPLDGTVNYLYRRPDFAVSIAAEVAGEVVAGAVFAPARAELFAATLGGGATLNGVPIRPSGEARLAHALCGTGFGYDAEVRRAQGAVLARVIHEVRDVRRAGSAALDLCAIACGRLDTYYERGLQPWDAAAAALIVREAGGRRETLPAATPDTAPTWIAANAALFPTFRALIVAVTDSSTPPRP